MATSASRPPIALPRAIVNTAIEWLNVQAGIDRRDAYALSAMTVSFRATQLGHQIGWVCSSDRQGMIGMLFPELVLGKQVAGRAAASMDPNL